MIENLTNEQLNKLVANWNRLFNVNEQIKDITFSDSDTLFNNFIDKISRNKTYNITDKICYCEKVDQNYNIRYAADIEKNEISTEFFNVRAKRKLFDLINNFEIIITNGFALTTDTAPKKTVLRYEVIRNIFTSNHTHFFSIDMPFSIDNSNIFLTEIFYNELKSNKNRLNTLKFSSYLLNTFELGVTIDEVILKPKITVSPYGRWYWSGTEKVQNDSKARNRIYNKLIKYGKIMNIDLISGEPTILQSLTKSATLKKLIKMRIKLYNEEDTTKLSSSIKNLMNIYIHSLNTPEIAEEQFRNDDNYSNIEKLLHMTILDIFRNLDNEFEEYNRKVIDEYRENLAMVECDRRIVNPLAIVMSDRDIIKEHRKFLQGHTHDKILKIAQNIYSNLGFIPLFTIHDSISYFINNHDEKPIIENVYKIANSLKTPVTIEIMEK